MRITELDFKTWKGLTGSVELSKLNLVTGPNGSGKTARLLGPAFAVTGSTPLGERAEAAAQLGGPAGCAVGATLDDGFAWTRSIRRKARYGTLSTSVDIVGQPAMGVREANPIVSEHCGTFAPMFDIGAFTGLSDDKRRDFVLDLCARARTGGDAIDADSIVTRAYLRVLLDHDDLGPGTVGMAAGQMFNAAPEALDAEQARALVDGVKMRLASGYRAAIENILGTVRMEITGEMTAAIGSALTKAKELKNAARADKDRSQAAQEKLIQKRDALPASTGTVEQMREERRTVDADRVSLVQQITAQESRASERERLTKRVEKREERDKELHARIKAMNDAGYPDVDEAERWEQEVADIDNAATAAAGLDAEQAAHDAADAAYRWLCEDRHAATNTTAALNATVNHEAAELKAAESDDWAEVLKLTDLLAESLRGVSDRRTEVLAEIAEIARRNRAADPGPIRSSLAGHRAELHEAQAKHEQLNEDAETAYGTLQEAIDTLTKARDARQEHERSRTERLTHAGKLRAKARERRRLAEEFDRAHKDLLRDIDHEDAQKIEEETALAEVDRDEGLVPLDELTAQYDRLVASLDEIDARIEAQINATALDKQLTECVAQAERETVVYEACDAVIHAIKTLREEIMAELVAPLVDRMQRFLDRGDVGVTVSCDLENGKGAPVFEPGWIADGRRIPLRAMSGGETALFTAALAYALTMLADPPLKLLLVEASELDAPNLMRLLECIEASADDLSNVMIATHAPVESCGAGWNVIHAVAAAKPLECVA